VNAVASDRPDLRLVPAAVATWAGVLVGVNNPGPPLGWLCIGVAVGVFVVARISISRPARLAAFVALACLLGGTLAGTARAAALRVGPVDELAEERAAVGFEAVLTTDPQPRPAVGGRPPYFIAMLRIESIAGRGTTTAVRTPVLVLAASPDWAALRPGQRVSAAGRLAPAERSGNVAALLRVRDPPQVLGPAGRTSRLTEPLRAGLRAAVGDLAEGPRGLVPALVIGDESMLPASLRADMEATGLTHLTAVSGDNVA
jgi:competence protein ComEC